MTVLSSTPSDNRKPATNPLVSIIVPTFNRANFLERCLRSILDQSYANIECIVMDGASKDGSVAILERLAGADKRLKFVSEPDKGEADAVNKALDLATGQIYGIQASDDFYTPGAVAAAIEFLLAHPEYTGVGGDALYVDEHGRSLNRGVITHRGEMSRDTIKHIIMVRYKSCLVCHGGFFGWRERVFRHGKLDPTYSVTPDWEFYLRLLAAGERIACLPRVQYHFSVHSGMGAQKYARKVENERAVLHKKYGLKWYHEFFRSTVGRAASYLSNPYRTPLLPGIKCELKNLLGRRS